MIRGHSHRLLSVLSMLFIVAMVLSLGRPPAADADWHALPQPNNPPPTLNIAAVAHAMQYDYKSLSTVVTAPPGLPLTKPVTISIGYFPSGTDGYGSYCRERSTQIYGSSTGNAFLCALPDGDGKQRRLHLDITLSEPNPAGGVYNYNLPLDMDLDPLYDVAIGPLDFELLNDCVTFGDTHIKLRWMNPLREQGDMAFTTRGGKMTVVPAFAWGLQEVGLSRNLLLVPELVFLEYSSLEGVGGNHEPYFNPLYWDVQAHTILAPGPARKELVKGGLKALNDSFCSAYFEYGSTFTLRAYFGAAPDVRDHR